MGVSWGGFIGSILCWGVPLRGVPIKGRFYGEGPIKGGSHGGRELMGGIIVGLGGSHGWDPIWGGGSWGGCLVEWGSHIWLSGGGSMAESPILGGGGLSYGGDFMGESH